MARKIGARRWALLALAVILACCVGPAALASGPRSYDDPGSDAGLRIGRDPQAVPQGPPVSGDAATPSRLLQGSSPTTVSSLLSSTPQTPATAVQPSASSQVTVAPPVAQPAAATGLPWPLAVLGAAMALAGALALAAVQKAKDSVTQPAPGAGQVTETRMVTVMVPHTVYRAAPSVLRTVKEAVTRVVTEYVPQQVSRIKTILQTQRVPVLRQVVRTRQVQVPETTYESVQVPVYQTVTRFVPDYEMQRGRPVQVGGDWETEQVQVGTRTEMEPHTVMTIRTEQVVEQVAGEEVQQVPVTQTVTETVMVPVQRTITEYQTRTVVDQVPPQPETVWEPEQRPQTVIVTRPAPIAPVSEKGEDAKAAVSAKVTDITALNQQLMQAKQQWWRAKALGSEQGMEDAHKLAEQLRAQGATISASVATTLDTANQQVLEAKEEWWKAHLAGSSDGEKRAQDKAEAARQAGASIAADTVTYIDEMYGGSDAGTATPASPAASADTSTGSASGQLNTPNGDTSGGRTATPTPGSTSTGTTTTPTGTNTPAGTTASGATKNPAGPAASASAQWAAAYNLQELQRRYEAVAQQWWAALLGGNTALTAQEAQELSSLAAKVGTEFANETNLRYVNNYRQQVERMASELRDQYWNAVLFETHPDKPEQPKLLNLLDASVVGSAAVNLVLADIQEAEATADGRGKAAVRAKAQEYERQLWLAVNADAPANALDWQKRIQSFANYDAAVGDAVAQVDAAQGTDLLATANGLITAAKRDWWQGLLDADQDRITKAEKIASAWRDLSEARHVQGVIPRGASIPGLDDSYRAQMFDAIFNVYQKYRSLQDTPADFEEANRWPFYLEHKGWWLAGHEAKLLERLNEDIMPFQFRWWTALVDEHLSLADRKVALDGAKAAADRLNDMAHALGLLQKPEDRLQGFDVTTWREQAVAYADLLELRQHDAKNEKTADSIQKELDFLAEYGIRPHAGVGLAGSGASLDGAPATSAEELQAKFTALGWTAMVPHAQRIWKYSQESHVQAEIVAALIRQESGGNENEGAGGDSGLGLMQLEWSVHKGDKALLDLTPGMDENQRKAWLLDPDNNISYGVKYILQPYLTHYGSSGDGLLRALMAWNYDSSSEDVVERNTKKDDWDDWEYQLWHYHCTHDGRGQEVSFDSPYSYGNAIHFFQARRYLDQLLGEERKPDLTAHADHSWPVELYKQTDAGWGDILLNKVKGRPDTWKNEGCTLTCLAMLARYYTGVQVDVHLMRLLRLYCTDECLSSKNYADNNGEVQWNGSKFDWFLQTLGVKVPGKTDITAGPENYDGLLQNLRTMLKEGPVILGGQNKTSPHWVIVKGYQGSGGSANDFQINDPYNDFTTLDQYLAKYQNVNTLVKMQRT